MDTCSGRLWAVRGRPRATSNDHGRPLSRWSGLRRVTASEAVGLEHQFLRNKRQEWEDYRRQVTEFERKRLLAVL
ncbi:hypothetical protein GCM10023178_41110 [Actinomadura luteofluorescens]